LWRARQFADRYAIPHSFSDQAELLARRDVNLVYVGNHPRHHASSVQAALRAGKHVLCEPPLALSVEEARQLAELADRVDLLLAVNHTHRADAAIVTLQGLLHNDAAGDILGGRVQNTLLLGLPQQTWRLRALGGGVLFDRSLHSLDLLRFLCADEIAEVFAVEGKRIWGAEVEEDVVMIVRMARRGVSFTVHDSFIIPHTPTSIEVYGAQSTLTAWRCLGEGKSVLWSQRAGEQQTLALREFIPLQESVAAMHRAATGSGQPVANAHDAVQGLAAVFAAQQSLQRGAPVRL
jgi:1,5-anhydro-D-fructose reductase (1,5-anhydro-D-mannitol-forming)